MYWILLEVAKGSAAQACAALNGLLALGLQPLQRSLAPARCNVLLQTACVARNG